MRIPILLLAGLLVFSHGFAADNLIRLSQPLKLDVPAKETAAKALEETSKDVAKTDTPASASESASAGVKSETPKSSGTPNVKKSAGKMPTVDADEEDAQQELAAKIKAKLAALRERQALKAQATKSYEHSYRKKPVKPKEADKPVVQEEHKHWAYEGEDGPSNWGKLNPAWAECDAGKRQSPIDIHDGIKVELEPIKFLYKPVHFKVTDNGHTIQVNLDAGNRITLTGKSYELVQFHFHRPSEERVNGKSFQMVVHLVHKSEDGKLAVVSLLVEEGMANNLIQTVWNNLPLEKNDPVAPVSLIDVTQLLPVMPDYYTYMGSLTTPPCSEGVLWLVMKQPIKLSSQQIAIFTRLYPMNARPLQTNDGRLIKESN